MDRLTLSLSPSAHLHLVPDGEAPELEAGFRDRMALAFGRGSGSGLLHLGGGEVGRPVPPVFAFWRDFAEKFLTLLCARPEGEADPTALEPPADFLMEMVLGAPIMPGAEYLDPARLERLWRDLAQALVQELEVSKGSLADFLHTLHPAWNLVGRVHFNLAENRRDPDAPFAFLASYTDRISAHGRPQHLPLGQALKEYATQKERLLSLLLPVQRAAEACDWLRQMVEAGALFHPLRWTPKEAFRFLQSVPDLERAGVVVRMPATWKLGRPVRPKVSATVGGKAPSKLGLGALLDFRMAVTLEGEDLTEAEIRELLAASQGLALIRGQWVEVDQERLGRMMDRFQEVQRLAKAKGLTFAEGLRLLSGQGALAEEDPETQWTRVLPGAWLQETLRGLRSPESLARLDPGTDLHATLRPYQEVGLRWLHLLSSLGLGACLADDMGLGKTIQIISLLLVLQRERAPKPNLLVAPASLLANWASELDRFAPSLQCCIAHPSFQASDQLRAMEPDAVQDLDLVLTSYGTLLRLPWMAETSWNLVIADEAQALKNPGARQTRAAKALPSRARIALTGTPVENRLGDLWSLFDFINPGLLGSAKGFGSTLKVLEARTHNPFGPLRDLVRPYILRRLKTDRTVIQDLPDKTELKAYCPLSRRQAALYQEAVADLARQLQETEDGIARRGLVLAFLLRFKQICNHPSQWLGDQAWAEEDSGKLGRLRDLAETIAAKQEKVLVFTQFRETTEPLAAFLAQVFGREGLVLHGGTPVKARRELVRRFQEDEGTPFFVLSIKAGGTGLNLTAASHVIHFDRWWNPAVENQATDRAFRIGQKRNVLVHKFVCRGTVEEKIDALIASKTKLSQEILEGGQEPNLTELGDDELLRLVRLDLESALEES